MVNILVQISSLGWRLTRSPDAAATGRLTCLFAVIRLTAVEVSLKLPGHSFVDLADHHTSRTVHTTR